MKKVVFLLMMIVCCEELMGQVYDTIWARNPKYYYSEWYDTCPGYTYPWTADNPPYYSYATCIALDGGYKLGISFYTERPLLIRGMAALVNIRPVGYCWLNDTRMPEYLSLYQYTTVMEFRDSVRWDTVTPKIMRAPKCIDTATFGYKECYSFEAMLKDPIRVDSTFYIAGTFNSNWGDRATSTYIPTEYFRWHYLTKDCHYSRKCTMYNSQFHGDPSSLGEHWLWYDDLTGIGAFVPIVDTLYLVRGESADSAQGYVTGGGYYVDSVNASLRAYGREGWRFSHWGDGDTTNPRLVYVLSDTTITAYYEALESYDLDVSTNNPEWGRAWGSGTYYEGSEVTISAEALAGYRFVRWSDGETENPREVTVTQDSVIVAQFVDSTESISGIPERRGLRLLPNPARERLEIAVDRADRYTARVYTVTGALWLREEFEGSEGSVDLSTLSPGTYLLRLDAKDFSTSEVFVKGK